MNNTKGFAAILLVTVVMFIIVAVAGYLYFSKTGEDYPGKEYVKKYTSSSDNTISDSDDPEVIQQEFNDTELSLDEFEKELDDLDTDLEEI